MTEQLFQTDLFTTDQGNGCAVCCGHDHLTADCPHGQAMTLELADATGTLTRQESADIIAETFTRNDRGFRTCRDCGATFAQADGAIMRSHRRRVHGEDHPTPGVCNA